MPKGNRGLVGIDQRRGQAGAGAPGMALWRRQRAGHKPERA
jgi:hypothetical protein